MEFSNNELGICGEARNVSQLHHDNTDNCNLKNKNRFANNEPLDINPRCLVCVLTSMGMPDGHKFSGYNVTEQNEVIEWRAILRLKRRDIEIKEVSDHRKPIRHRNGVQWLLNNGIFYSADLRGGK